MSRLRAAASLVCLALPLALAGCAARQPDSPYSDPASARRQFFEANLKTLQVATATYEAAMRQVGRASAQGLISDGQVTSATAAGQIVKDSIDAAREALLVFRADPTVDQSNAVARVLAVEQRILELQRIIQNFGRLQ